MNGSVVAGDAAAALSLDKQLEEKKEEGPTVVASPPQGESNARRSLRQSLLLRKNNHSLTTREYEFLQTLIQHGTEKEVQCAQTTLMNDNLFVFEDNNTIRSGKRDQDDDDDDDSSLEDDWQEKIQVLVTGSEGERGPSSKTAASVTSTMPVVPESINDEDDKNGKDDGNNGGAVGSKQRQELLETRRRDSRVYSQMWRAHEFGLSTTTVPQSTTSKAGSTAAAGRRESSTGSRRASSIFSEQHLFGGSSLSPGARRRLSSSLSTSVRSSRSSTHSSSIRTSAASTGRQSGTSSKVSIDSGNNIKGGYSIGLESLQEAVHGEEDHDEDVLEAVSTEAATASATAEKESLIWRRASMNEYQGQGIEVEDDNLVNDDYNGADDDVVADKPRDQLSAQLAPLVFMRRASKNVYQGEGVELANFPSVQPSHHQHKHHHTWSTNNNGNSDMDIDDSDNNDLLRLSNTFDETMSYERVSAMFHSNSSSYCLNRSLSDDGLNIQSIMDRLDSIAFEEYDETDKDTSISTSTLDFYDSWLGLDDEFVSDKGDSSIAPSKAYVMTGLCILGTTADDESALPHVLSPPLMSSLQPHLPWSKRGETWWLKYSLVRDGASLISFLKHARGAKASIIAIETTNGEVMGSMTSEAWHINGARYFGNGESFLWRMQHNRNEKSHSVIDQCEKESKIDVFPFTHNNQYIQLCRNEELSIGGGTADTIDSYTVLPELDDQHDSFRDYEYGAGLHLTGDLLQGTSSPCLTFGSPSLSKIHSHGSKFDILNIELWSLTPCTTLQEAEKLELSQLFLEEHGRFTSNY